MNTSPLYETLRAKGAVFEEVRGLERPRWFARDGLEARDYYSFRRNEVHDMLSFECKAVRERVGIIDITAFAKVEVAGPDAEALLNRLVANRLPRKVGRMALTHMLNRRGGVEIELTVFRLAEDRFYMACGFTLEQNLMDFLEQNREPHENVEIINRSSTWSALSLQGPRAREVLAATTDAKLDNASFPWLTAQEISVAGVPLWALRVSYAGELGWELHAPAESILPVYEALWRAGEAHGIADYGSFAMNSLRIEKAFRAGGELSSEVTLHEAGEMRFVDMDKGDFIGRRGDERAHEKAERDVRLCPHRHRRRRRGTRTRSGVL